jgi:hypothetical protein
MRGTDSASVDDDMEKRTENALSAPFLSVIVRTVEHREMFLLDTLVSLAAQTSPDFEVLLMAHDVGSRGLQAIEDSVCDFDPEFSARVMCRSVAGGGRARPFNVGASLAVGEYFACIDDNAVAFGHWVETFKSAASSAPGRVVRARVASQTIEPMLWDDRAGYVATSGISTPFPEDFDLWEYLFEDRSPNCGFALPRKCLEGTSSVFDESLQCGEEKELIVRAVALNGIADSGEVTALMRAWGVTDRGQVDEEARQWDLTRSTVVSRLNEASVQLPPGTFGAVDRYERDLVGARATIARTERERDAARREVERLQREYDSVMHSNSWRLTRPMRNIGDLLHRARGRSR